MSNLVRSLTATAQLYSIELSEDQITGYVSALKEWHPDDVIAALSICVKECRFFPKISEIIVRIPTRPTDNYIDEPDLSDAERALNKDLFPLFIDYLEHRTTLGDWVAQMQYFADKHGLGDRMERAIRKEGF